MEQRLIIAQGPTFKGWPSTIGIFVAISGIVFISLSFSNSFTWALIRFTGGVLLILAGIQLFLSFRGVVIDTQSMHVKSYIFLFGRLGEWTDISGYSGFSYTKFDLTETQGLVTAFTTIHTKYVDLFLLNPETRDRILIKSCSNRKEADAIKSEIAPLLGIDPES